MKVANLKVNHLEKPLGFTFDGLNFSWEILEKPESSELIISKDYDFSNILYQSGKIENINNLSFSVDIALEARTRYFWKLRLYTQDEFSDSEVSWFESGKLDESWIGKWITGENKKEQSIVVRKDFELKEKPVKARLYIAGVGLFEAEINSKKVGEEYLMPGYHSYDNHIQYHTFDITDYLQKQNRIGVILGNGWYRGRFGFDGGYKNLYGDELAMICELHVEYENKETEIITSDKSWNICKSMILENNIYDGEIVCGNQYLDNYSNIDVSILQTKTKELDISNMSKLQARRNLPIVIKEYMNPIELIKTKNNNWVLDFGQNMSGWVEFNVNEAKGKKIVLKYAEHFQDGEFYNVNLRTAKAEFVYHSLGIKQRVRPHFTFYGFRYVMISGIEQPDINDFKACVIYSDMKSTGNITTGNDMLNKFIQNTLWSQKGNFLDIPTDCPQRDERMGWTGDAQIFFTTSAYNMDVSVFFAKYMYDLNYEQSLIDGAVPNIVPRLKLPEFDGFIDGYGASPWADAATIIPWNLYVMYGDKNLLSNHYEGMKSWIEYASNVCKENGNEFLWTEGFHFADWLALDNYKNPYSPIGATEPFFVASVYYYYSTLLVSKAAKVLGLNGDENYFSNKAMKIKGAIVKEYFSANGRISIDTQTARVLAIHFELLPEEQLLRLGNELAKMVVDNNMHLDTGFVGTPLICSALTKTNQAKYAFNLLLNEEYPSWLYEVKMGSTTVWERWNSIMEDGRINETGMNSLNHYAYGAVVQWIYEEVAGIKPMESNPGFKEFYLYPSIDGRLKNSNVSYQSVMGEIISNWEVLMSGELKFEFKVPVGSIANVRLPISEDDNKFMNYDKYAKDGNWMYFRVFEGEHEFIYTSKKDYIPRYSLEIEVSEILKNEVTNEIVQKYMGDVLLEEKETVDMMLDKPLTSLVSDYHLMRHLNDTIVRDMNNELMRVKYTKIV